MVATLKGTVLWLRDFISLVFLTGLPKPGFTLWNASLVLARYVCYAFYLLLITGMVQSLQAEDTGLSKIIDHLVRTQPAADLHHRTTREIHLLGFGQTDAERMISKLADFPAPVTSPTLASETSPTPEVVPETVETSPTPEVVPETAETSPTPEVVPETAEPSPTPEVVPETASGAPELAPKTAPASETASPTNASPPQTLLPASVLIVAIMGGFAAIVFAACGLIGVLAWTRLSAAVRDWLVSSTGMRRDEREEETRTQASAA